jgi:signal transduction histidine kinase/CheY-like chemotaxis protein
LDAIRAAASMLGASIHQMQAEESIRESHRRLEMTLAELESSQRQLVQRERLAAVGQLAAGIAHDFNNTLGVIQLYSEMLLRECDRPKQKERVETILSQAHRAANLTQQVVDFSRKTVLTRRPLDLVPFIRDFVDTILPIMPKDIQLVADFGPVDYVVSADAGRLQQVLMNLALNARDAMPKGGTLRMRVDSLALQPQDPPPYRNMAPGNWVRIRVSDTGTGIDDQALPHIFEPFFTTKSLGKGTGLGLAQVYGIVKQHDGFIDVETRVGEGTTFVMYLPQESQLATDAIGPSAGESPEAHGETILIVEDDVDTLRVVCEVLQAGGYKTLQACDGQAALEILRSAAGDVDLVLSDMVMPSIGGLDLFRVMRKENPALRMILMTGHPLGEKGNAMPDTESLDSLQKPFTRDALLCKVRSVLER